MHVQVGDFDLVDPLLDDAWGVVAEAGTPVVVHAGGGPVGNDHTGPGPMRALMERHPTLTAVVAHLGAPEYDGFLAIAEDFERVHLDTTMAFTDFFEEMAAFPRDQLSRGWSTSATGCCSGRTSRTIPYPYAHQLESLERLGLGDDWLRGVCWSNAASAVRLTNRRSSACARGRGWSTFTPAVMSPQHGTHPCMLTCPWGIALRLRRRRRRYPWPFPVESGPHATRPTWSRTPKASNT